MQLCRASLLNDLRHDAHRLTDRCKVHVTLWGTPLFGQQQALSNTCTQRWTPVPIVGVPGSLGNKLSAPAASNGPQPIDAPSVEHSHKKGGEYSLERQRPASLARFLGLLESRWSSETQEGIHTHAQCGECCARVSATLQVFTQE